MVLTNTKDRHKQKKLQRQYTIGYCCLFQKSYNERGRPIYTLYAKIWEIGHFLTTL